MCSPDFENPQGSGTPASNTYKLVVSAADAATGGQTGYHAVEVTVTNVSEPGEMTWTVAPAGGAISAPTLKQFEIGAVLAASATDGDISGADKSIGTAAEDEAATWRWYRGSVVIPGRDYR